MNDNGYTGGCQCGAVRFHATELRDNPHVCYCRMCQKASGNLFSALVGVRHEHLSWTRGAAAEFDSSDLAARGFCSACGTPLYYRSKGGPHVSMAIGSFDEPHRIELLYQMGMEGKHPSLLHLGDIEEAGTTEENDGAESVAEIAASNHQHPDHDTEDWQPRTGGPEMSELRLTGGCQCGAIRYETTMQPDNVHVCHCRMCQKAVAGPFAVICPVLKTHFRVTRGEMAYFHSSDIARRGFCRDCGTPLTFEYPHVPDLGLLVGTFDEPDRIPPVIQYGNESRVSWYGELGTLPGDRPTYAEDPAMLERIRSSSHQHPDHDTEHWTPHPGGQSQ